MRPVALLRLATGLLRLDSAGKRSKRSVATESATPPEPESGSRGVESTPQGVATRRSKPRSKMLRPATGSMGFSLWNLSSRSTYFSKREYFTNARTHVRGGANEECFPWGAAPDPERGWSSRIHEQWVRNSARRGVHSLASAGRQTAKGRCSLMDRCDYRGTRIKRLLDGREISFDDLCDDSTVCQLDLRCPECGAGNNMCAAHYCTLVMEQVLLPPCPGCGVRLVAQAVPDAPALDYTREVVHAG